MPMSMYEICVNSILVWQLSEANKGTKVEISASKKKNTIAGCRCHFTRACKVWGYKSHIKPICDF